jgi:hypothetical protein
MADNDDDLVDYDEEEVRLQCTIKQGHCTTIFIGEARRPFSRYRIGSFGPW